MSQSLCPHFVPLALIVRRTQANRLCVLSPLITTNKACGAASTVSCVLLARFVPPKESLLLCRVLKAITALLEWETPLKPALQALTVLPKLTSLFRAIPARYVTRHLWSVLM